MPFALIAIGLILLITGARGTQAELGALLKADFTGDRNFFYWIASIGAVGSLGYIPEAQKFSRVFIILIILVMILSNGGVFQRFQEALGSIKSSGKSYKQPDAKATASEGGSSGDGSNNPISSALNQAAGFINSAKNLATTIMSLF